MSEKRRDNKGRILKTGESQRKDGLYQYRYSDVHKIRRTIYANTLTELREKEKSIQRDIDDNIDYCAGKITVKELMERYLELKSGLKLTTIRNYEKIYKIISRERLAELQVSLVKISDCKDFILQLNKEGKKYSTIKVLYVWIKSVFKMACQDDIIRKNPFDFKLSTVIKREDRHMNALSKEEQKELLRFLKEYNSSIKNEIIVLLNTGMRVSELCGLTIDCLDFDKNTIKIVRQIIKIENREAYIQSTKTFSSERIIPMTYEAKVCFQNTLSEDKELRANIEIDGISGFVFLNSKKHTVRTMQNIGYELRTLIKKHNELYPNNRLPNFSPHILRHTFCTNLVNAGVNIKDVQYLMGHSDCSMTLDLYAHCDAERAMRGMLEALENGVNVV